MTTTYEEARTVEEREVDADVLRRVRRGIAALQEEHGGDEWVEKIDLATLDLRQPGRCVLGQVYGSFGSGLGVLFGPLPNLIPLAEDHGFLANKDYDPLQEAWERELTPRVERR